MCTCISFNSNDFYFGRNLDLEYNFGEKVIITPRDYLFKLRNGDNFYNKYSFIGMATCYDNYPLYADSCNEKGLCMAGLYFPGNAKYNKQKNDYKNIATFEFIPWILGSFSNVLEVLNGINKLNITNENFNKELPVADLHWMISDREKSIVVEQTEEGLKVYDNPYGVLTNNPPFYFHKTNLNNYMNLTSKTAINRFSDKIELNGYGQGMGMIGLPGDVTPTSRFVRATFNKFNSIRYKENEKNISQVFHILDSVAVIEGTVITKEERNDMTIYSSCINATKGIYYYKTYYNNQITGICLNEKNMNSNKLEIYNLSNEQNVKYLNNY